MTFSGHIVHVSPKDLRPLESSDLEGLDMVLGPKADFNIAATEMTNCLVKKGYCRSYMFTSAASLEQVQEALEDVEWSRVPADFEPYYLGRDSKEKTSLIDFEAGECPDAVRTSPLAQHDATLSGLSNYLTPCIEDAFG